MSKELRFLQITAKQQDFFYHISNDKSFIPKYPDKRSYRFRFNFTNIEATIGGKSSRERFCRNSSLGREILLQAK